MAGCDGLARRVCCAEFSGWLVLLVAGWPDKCLASRGLVLVAVADFVWLLVAGIGSCAGWRLEREKGIRWMPWHQEAMKDVARCEKPRGAASRR